jgi:hypothetical protein
MVFRWVWRYGDLAAAGASFERAATLLEQRAAVKNKFLGISSWNLRLVDNFWKAQRRQGVWPASGRAV